MNVATRLDPNRSADLGKYLPLDTPYVLAVDPSSLCNLRCLWCPSGHEELINQAVGRKQKIMDMALFRKIIEQSGEFSQQIRVLRLYKEGEPLVNPHFPEMVAHAKKSGYVKRVDTTSNGVLLNKHLNREIVEAGLDQINISVNGITSEQMMKNTKREIDFDEYVENIRDLYLHRGNCTVYVKSIKDILTMDEQQKFLDIFSPISDRIFLERLAQPWPRFDAMDSGYACENIGNYGQAVENRKVCPYLFYVMVINADGTVSTCIGDWNHTQIIGDLKDSKLRDIWLGEEEKRYWMEHCNGNKDTFNMCSRCQVITHGAYDNIDAYRHEILGKIRTTNAETCMPDIKIPNS